MTVAAARRIPLLDLQAQHKQIREEILPAILRVVDSQRFVLGEEVAQLEEEIAAYCGTRFAVGCASGTDALSLALMALGVGPGDEVVTTPYTFFATVSTIVRVGATPVFVDIEEDTFNFDASLLEGVLDRHPKVKAILPVHLFGQCPDMDPILELACARGIPVIEDAAQSIGAEYKGRRAGNMGLVGCFSFFPSKNLGGYGDGGILTTNDEGLKERLAALRVHGSKVKYVHEWVGLNSRLDALQAAVLRVKLRHLDGWTEGRRTNAALYRAALTERGAPVALPAERAFSTRHVYNQFVIRSAKRDAAREHLGSRGIGTEVYYPIPLHLQQCFASLGYRQGDLPVSEAAARETIALPIYAELGPEDIAYIADAIAEFHRADAQAS